MFTNHLKTTLLLTFLTVFFVGIGYFLLGEGGMIIFFFISLLMNFFTYFFSDKMAIMMSGSQSVTREQAPQIYQDTEALADKMGIPTPRIYIAPQSQPNAFATGRNPRNGVISLTQGLIDSLTREEVKAVIAHELGHIKNRDILIGSIAAVVAGAISMIARSVGFFGSSDNRNIFSELAIMITAPIVAIIIQMAISRSREYIADASAAEALNTGEPLASALLKIESIARQAPMNINPSMASMYISNPLKIGGIQQLFSTHPSTASRIAKLRRI
jgi:heat shock protein HtpX